MNDLISRQAAIDAFEGEVEVTGLANAVAVRGYANLVLDRILRLPSAEPERKTGKWEHYLKEGLKWKCSVCGSRFENPWKYCPNCGAKMVGESNVKS